MCSSSKGFQARVLFCFGIFSSNCGYALQNQDLIVYGPDVKEIARHELYPLGITAQKRSLPAHSPGRDHLKKCELLQQRFAEFGAEGVRFFDELLRARRLRQGRGRARAGIVAFAFDKISHRDALRLRPSHGRMAVAYADH